MPSVEYTEKPTNNHWVDHNLKVYTYKDLLPYKDFVSLQKLVTKYYEKPNNNNFLIHGTVLHLNNQKLKLVASEASQRYQEITFDWTYHSEWIKQNPETIKDWSNKQLYSGMVDAPLIKFIKFAETLPPFNDNPNDWVCYRLHFNMLKSTNSLQLHRDSGAYLFNKSIEKTRCWSLTYYLWDHIEGEGGEVFTEDGWVYKPKENSGICINGHVVIHGVTANMSASKKPRLAFTTRWLHVDDINFESSENTVLYDYEAYDKFN